MCECNVCYGLGFSEHPCIACGTMVTHVPGMVIYR